MCMQGCTHERMLACDGGQGAVERRGEGMECSLSCNKDAECSSSPASCSQTRFHAGFHDFSNRFASIIPAWVLHAAVMLSLG